MTRRPPLARFVGRAPEQIPPKDWPALLGAWIALELYSPRTLPLRRIEAAGRSVEECAGELRERGLDPRNFEFQMFRRPV